MSVVRWSRTDALRPHDPLELDELDEIDVLVLADVAEADSCNLRWCRRAPCVVIACAYGADPSTAVDVTLVDGDVARYLDDVICQIEANPSAARTLVDVLRVVEGLDGAAGLVVESLAYSTLLAGPEFARWLAAQPPRSPVAFAAPPVRVVRVGSELHVTLARPENRNAFSAEMRDALFEALVPAEVDPTIEQVVIDGDGPVFCSGGDLGQFGAASDVVRAHQIRTLRSIGALITRLAPMVTVHLHGSCVGAGVELSAFAGTVRAEAGATLLLPEVAMGLIPGAGGTVSLTRRIGRQRTALLALWGRPVELEDALLTGLVGVAP
ncbi:MAG: enoyl-CoA hydratase/isomerase family protein [Acidimicrobiales bacterium]